MQPVASTVVARKVDNKWEVALISNGRFVRAFTGNDLSKLVSPLLVANLQNAFPNDTEISINVVTTIPEAKNDESPNN